MDNQAAAIVVTGTAALQKIDRRHIDRQITPTLAALGVTVDDDKDKFYRMNKFAQWLDENEREWHDPDLGTYRDHLVRTLAPATAAAHLSTIRAHYRDIVESNRLRDLFYSMLPGDAKDAANRKAYVDELITRIQNAVAPGQSSVEMTKHQDVDDRQHLRLTTGQADALLRAPGLDTLQGLRDTAIIAMMLCTGAREMEIAALHVEDLRSMFGGALALRIRKGKGKKARLVPYGELDWCLLYVEKWLTVSGITSGAVFRGFYKPHKDQRPRVRETAITTRAIQKIMDEYPVIVDGRQVSAKPHDLRRTYARRLYDAGVTVEAIQQNLGHANTKTTMGYIGILDAAQRAPVRVFNPPHLKDLDRVTML